MLRRETVASSGTASSSRRDSLMTVAASTAAVVVLAGRIVTARSRRHSLEKENLQKDNSSAVISNMDHVSQGGCTCYGSFSGEPEQVEFYLPKMSVICTCGFESQRSLASEEDPLLLENILRPWQVEFLNSLGIKTATEFLEGRRNMDIPRALKKWKRKRGYGKVSTKMCQVATHIWSKPCKDLVETDFETKEGKLARKPSFLDASVLTATSAATTDSDAVDSETEIWT